MGLLFFGYFDYIITLKNFFYPFNIQIGPEQVFLQPRRRGEYPLLQEGNPNSDGLRDHDNQG
jgi:hypothetical protein